MKKIFGFSMLEVMVVLAIIAILAAMALPSYIYRIAREQIEKSMPLAEIAQTPIAMRWKTEQKMFLNNTEAGLPSPEKVVNNYVKSVSIEDGAIHITFGNRATGVLKDKTLTLRPAVVEDSPVVPVTWVCGAADAPKNMVVKGENKTTIEKQYLPLLCQERKS